jgi:hypothetical protein
MARSAVAVVGGPAGVDHLRAGTHGRCWSGWYEGWDSGEDEGWVIFIFDGLDSCGCRGKGEPFLAKGLSDAGHCICGLVGMRLRCGSGVGLPMAWNFFRVNAGSDSS